MSGAAALIPKRVIAWQWQAIAFAAVLTVALGACDRRIIRGQVLDMSKSALPGVAVTIPGTENESLTNALGEYVIPYETDRVELRFAKTGYAPAQRRLTLPDAGQSTAPPVTLWRLPSGAGVYLYENNRFTELSRDEPQRLFLLDGSVSYGTGRSPQLVTDRTSPIIVCYKTPRYDARVSRLGRVEAKRRAGEASVSLLWVAEETKRVPLLPLDDDTTILLYVALDGPLEPGTYAVHWGALEGYTTLEARMFVFSVAPLLEPAASPAQEEPAVAAPPEAEGAPASLEPPD